MQLYRCTIVNYIVDSIPTVTALLSIWNDLSHDFIDRQSCHFKRDFDRVLLQLVDIWNTQLKPRVQLTFITEMFELLTEKFDSLLLNKYLGHTACSLEKLNFKV